MNPSGPTAATTAASTPVSTPAPTSGLSAASERASGAPDKHAVSHSARQTQPIGVFDSGLGGLTVLQAINDLLPHESTVYFGDTGRTPYGTKSPDTVIKYAQQISRFLLEQPVKMIVIACNTASALAFEAVRQMVSVPVIEVITPGAQAAASSTRNQRIGIIGTRGTVNSGVYVRAVQAAGSNQPLILQKACPLFVGLAEEGWWDHDITRAVAAEYLAELKTADIDTLVLGCTHYPLLSPVLSDFMGPQVTLINAGSNVASQVQTVLSSLDLRNPGLDVASHTFFTSDDAIQFQQLGSVFLNRSIQAAGRIDIERY